MKSALRHLETELAALEAAGLRRRPAEAAANAHSLVLCANDYLSYAGENPFLPGTLPGGAGASRLVSGDHASHRVAERALARWVMADDALLFSSGYAANLGVIGALAGPGDVIVSDILNHASIIDGCRLSRAAVVVVPHLDTDAVDRALRAASSARRRWMLTESYFSMDGDVANLEALRRICDQSDAALIVDEAHALGVFGPRGAGLCQAAGIRPDVLVGTLGKAVGLQGAFVAGSSALRSWLWNRARSFVFSTAVSPQIAAATTARVERIQTEEGRRARLHQVTAQLRERLIGLGLDFGTSTGPILPWVVGAPERVLALSSALGEEGVRVQAIRPPTVPNGTSRLRITASSGLSDADVERAVAAFRRVLRG